MAGLIAGAVPAGAAGVCTDPPPVYPESSLHAGQAAVGHTVIQGTTQTSFDVEILGVQPDGIAPGIDFILAQITGPPSFLDETGGIVAGMSGSPVYIGDELVGSTSYGFFAADQTIMGITPAQPMVDLFNYPSTAPATSGPNGPQAPMLARRVVLSSTLRQRAAQAAGTSAAEFPAAATQLPVPLSVSGLNRRAMTRMKRVLNHFNVPTILYRGGSASAPQPGTGAPLVAGDSLSAALSYGDLTIAGIGTATAACADMVVGFGHPFTLSGAVTMGMNGADVLKVIKDPSNIFGGFKFANVTDLVGSVDQDRFAGIRGVNGDLPALTTQTTTINNPDLDKTRSGETDIVRDLNLGPFFIDVPIIAAFAMLSEEDVAFDRIGDGSVHLNWSIEGTAPDGSTFTLTRDDRFYSEYDATIYTIFELYGILEQLQHSKFGDATFSTVDTHGSVTQDQLTTSIVRVLSSSSIQRRLDDRRRLTVRPGEVVHLRVLMRDHGATGKRPVDMYVKIPRRMRSGDIYIRAGRGTFGGFFGNQSKHAKSFSQLVRKLANGEHNYDIVAELSGRGGSGGKGKPVPLSRSRRVHSTTVSHQESVVRGRDFIDLRVR
jgi:hypothetical protein